MWLSFTDKEIRDLYDRYPQIEDISDGLRVHPGRFQGKDGCSRSPEPEEENEDVAPHDGEDEPDAHPEPDALGNEEGRPEEPDQADEPEEEQRPERARENHSCLNKIRVPLS
jgi:hypothetical protein